MSSRENDDDAKAEIRRAVFDEPWKTHQAIADDLGVSRSWVSGVVGDDEELQEIREAYRKGVSLDAYESTVGAIADAVEPQKRAVAKRLREAARRDELDQLTIELQISEKTD